MWRYKAPEDNPTLMDTSYDSITEYHLWVVRHRRTKEPVMLVKSKHPVPSREVVIQTYIALYPDKKLITSLRTDVHRDDGFTPNEWETWLAFGVCPAIEIYTDELQYYTKYTKWKWQRVMA